MENFRPQYILTYMRKQALSQCKFFSNLTYVSNVSFSPGMIDSDHRLSLEEQKHRLYEYIGTQGLEYKARFKVKRRFWRLSFNYHAPSRDGTVRTWKRERRENEVGWEILTGQSLPIKQCNLPRYSILVSGNNDNNFILKR